MRLAVFGPTGKTGQHVVQQALGRGYAVYAVARRPESVPARHKNLTVIGGDVLSPDGWASQLAGVDAIISALGGGMQRAPTTIYSAGTSAVVSAMTRNGIDRIAVISAEPAGGWHEAGALKRLLAYQSCNFFSAPLMTTCAGWSGCWLRVLLTGLSCAPRISPTGPRGAAIDLGLMDPSNAR